jgi:hypothetical protein
MSNSNTPPSITDDDGTGGEAQEATIPPVSFEYEYDESLSVPTEVVQLWIEVGNGIDKNQTGKSFTLCFFAWRVSCRSVLSILPRWNHFFSIVISQATTNHILFVLLTTVDRFLCLVFLVVDLSQHNSGLEVGRGFVSVRASVHEHSQCAVLYRKLCR